MMHQTASLVILVLLTAGLIQSRPLDEEGSGDGTPTTPGCHPPRCFYNSKCYEDGEEISQGFDGIDWCYGLLCSRGGPIAWDSFNCGPTTTEPPVTATDPPQTTTTPAPPTTLLGCLNEGVRYPVGSEISRGSNTGWCYRKICGEDGQVHEIECDQTKTTQLTPHPTTAIPTTDRATPPGCVHNDVWYPSGSEISEESDDQGCYGYYCDDNGQLMVWDNFDCGQSTTTQTSSPPPTPTPTPLGCHHNGKWYPPGSEMSKGSDGKGWCYGSYCDDYGQEVAWDDWNCGPSTTPTPDPTPTPPLTPKGCLENGKWYPPGSEISRGSDGEGWCYGEYCTHDGQVQLWDDWNCSPKSQPTTLPTTPPKGCYYEGKFHPPGTPFEGSDVRGCRYGAYCGMDGQVIRWDEFNCQL